MQQEEIDEAGRLIDGEPGHQVEMLPIFFTTEGVWYESRGLLPVEIGRVTRMEFVGIRSNEEPPEPLGVLRPTVVRGEGSGCYVDNCGDGFIRTVSFEGSRDGTSSPGLTPTELIAFYSRLLEQGAPAIYPPIPRTC